MAGRDMDEVQPVDGYVKNLLKHAKEKYDLDIDLEEPTRRQRLEAAVRMKDESNGWYSMEIMVGRRVDSSEPAGENFAFLAITQALSPDNPYKFYNGFAHIYWPGKEEVIEER